MSTSGGISAALRSGALREAQVDLYADETQCRRVLLRPEVFKEIYENQFQDREDAVAAICALIDRFVSGATMSIASLTSGQIHQGDIKALQDADEGVWEFRMDSDPNVRLFGRFIFKDVFVGTGIGFKGAKFTFNVAQMRTRCKSFWASAGLGKFVPCDPHMCMSNVKVMR